MKSGAGKLLAVSTLLLLYGSLYPWQFDWGAPGNALSSLLSSWPDPLNPIDVAANVFLYLPIGALGVFAFGSRNPLVLLYGLVLSTSVEILQFWIPRRVASLADVAANLAGTACGIACVMLWRRFDWPVRRPDSLVMICCWLAYQTFPFVLAWGPGGARWFDRLGGTLAPVDVLLFCAEVLVLAIMAESLMPGARWWILLAVVPLKLAIAGRALTAVELAGSAIAWAAVAKFRPRAPAAAIVLGFAIVLHGLAPLHFQTAPNPFSWTPFQASWETPWTAGFVILLGKCFRYGALVWVAREAGLSLRIAAIAIAGALGAVELMQQWLPGRTAEITDPLLAVLLALLMGMAPATPPAQAIRSPKIGATP